MRRRMARAQHPLLRPLCCISSPAPLKLPVTLTPPLHCPAAFTLPHPLLRPLCYISAQCATGCGAPSCWPRSLCSTRSSACLWVSYAKNESCKGCMELQQLVLWDPVQFVVIGVFLGEACKE